MTVTDADPLGKPWVEIIGKRPARRGDHTHIDRIAPVQADWSDLAGGERAVSSFLRLLGQHADLIEDQRARLGLDQLADLRGRTRLEGALLMTEQFAVDDVRRNRLAVD